uniref:Retrovirus-related Pol polyprotein from transposon TNT 1-94 n=1 Tax=Tanacetum cinerariifolium TaxID=118510 RepID=A0A699H8U1_TANCI|nr:retrovirus-related Pol polyprotein from transposon TNT 1-94 [Tanacetum cinerariifolium]
MRDALDYIHSDLCGHLMLHLEEHKDEVFPTFKEWKVLIENQTGMKIKKLRIDNGLEFCGEIFNVLCRKYGIGRHHTLVRTPQQNGVAERMNRTIMEKVRCNSVDYSNLRVFGCPVYVHVTEGKLVSRAVKCIFLGYGFGVKGYRVWCPDPKYRKIIHSRDVTFNEDDIINSGKDFVPPHNVDNNHTEGKVDFEFDVENSTHTQPSFNDEHIETQDAGNMPTSPQKLEQFEVKTAFLYGHLEEESYVEQPKGFKVPVKEDHVCRLKYYDECVYLRKFLEGSFLYLVLYVDDMLITTPNKDQIRELKDQLTKEFDMKDLGAGKRILGMEIQRDRKMSKLTLSQTDYISKVLKFNMYSCKPVPTPLAPHFKLSSHECPKSEGFNMSSLMYVMVCTRLDLAHAVSVVTRYMHNPGKMHWEAVKCIIRYLKRTSNIGLSFEKGHASPKGFVGYVDSDYAGVLDARKSLSSYIFSHCGSAISWYSSLQAITALSTTEVEYISSTEGVKEVIWLRGMANEFGLPQEVLVVYRDNRKMERALVNLGLATFKTLSPRRTVKLDQVRNPLLEVLEVLYANYLEVYVIDSPITPASGDIPVVATLIVPKDRERYLLFDSDRRRHRLILKYENVSRLILIMNKTTYAFLDQNQTTNLFPGL